MIVHDGESESPERVHPASDPDAGGRLTLADLTGIRVLLVDDDADALQMAKDALNAARGRSHSVSNADDALGALDRERSMSSSSISACRRVDGYQLLRRIRKHADRSRRTHSGRGAHRLRALDRPHPIAEGRVSDASVQAGAPERARRRGPGAGQEAGGVVAQAFRPARYQPTCLPASCSSSHFDSGAK